MHRKLLENIESIIDLDHKDITFIKNVFTQKTFKKGEFFVREGQIARKIGFIINGLIGFYWNNDGDIKVFDFGKTGDYVANYKSCTEGSPSEMVLEFLEDTTMLCISYENFELLFQEIKQGERFGRILLTQLFLYYVQRVTQFYKNTPEQRYSEFISTHFDLVDRIPQYLISSFIGIQPQSLSRIKKAREIVIAPLT